MTHDLGFFVYLDRVVYTLHTIYMACLSLQVRLTDWMHLVSSSVLYIFTCFLVYVPDEQPYSQYVSQSISKPVGMCVTFSVLSLCAMEKYDILISDSLFHNQPKGLVLFYI